MRMDDWWFHDNLQQVEPTDLIRNHLRQIETGIQSKWFTLCLFLLSSIYSWWRFEIKPGAARQPRKHLPAPVSARAPGHTGWRQQSRWDVPQRFTGECPWFACPPSPDIVPQLPGIHWNTTLCVGNRQLSLSHWDLGETCWAAVPAAQYQPEKSPN